MKNWNVIKKSLIFRSMMQRSSQNQNIWQIFLKSQQQFGKAEESIQLADGRHHASVKRKWNGSADIHFLQKILQK